MRRFSQTPGRWFRRARRGLCLSALVLAGCQANGSTTDDTGTTVAENLAEFIQDFLREALAAYLL